MLVLKEKIKNILSESIRMGEDWGNSKVEELAKEALTELNKFPFIVYSGIGKVELGGKKPSALCESWVQANALIKTLWPKTGYWEKE
jgi:hypothetical protein